MIDISGKQQASVFLNSEDITPSPEIISNLLNIFRNEEFLQNTFEEIGPTGIEPNVRLRLNSKDKEWDIFFASHRIDIVKNPINKNEKNISDLEIFTKHVCDFYSRILSQFNKKGNRLSIITNGLLKEMTDKQLNSIYEKFLNVLPFYKTHIPFQWNSRLVSRLSRNISGIEEKIIVNEEKEFKIKQKLFTKT